MAEPWFEDFPTPILADLAGALWDFEAGASVADTGAGSRREGQDFEEIVWSFWGEVARVMRRQGARQRLILGPRRRAWASLTRGERSVLLPVGRADAIRIPVPFPQPQPASDQVREWLRMDHEVIDMVGAFPGLAEAAETYSPAQGPFAGPAYSEMFDRLGTEFDDVIVLSEGGELTEKILLEYKTAKSSRGVQIDGNAHERLSFQMMQYLEIAATYPACSLIVVTNGAFARYRNKYHVNFQIQAERLRVFPWFNLFYACEPSRYAIMANRIADWLNQADRPANPDETTRDPEPRPAAPSTAPDAPATPAGPSGPAGPAGPNPGRDTKPPILPARHVIPGSPR